METSTAQEKACAFCRGSGQSFDGKRCAACSGAGAVVQKTIGNGRDICLVVEEPARAPAWKSR